MMFRINLTLAIVLLLLIVSLTNYRKVDFTRPNFELLPDMAHSPAYSAFAENENFEDGKTLRAPVSNTIAWGEFPLHYEATKEDALRAGEELKNPFTAEDEGVLARGEFVYLTFCAPCHDAGGTGFGPVVAKGFPPPASLVTGDSTKMKDGQLFHIITFGGENMPHYAERVSREDRWKVILYIRSLEESVVVPEEEGDVILPQPEEEETLGVEVGNEPEEVDDPGDADAADEIPNGDWN